MLLLSCAFLAPGDVVAKDAGDASGPARRPIRARSSAWAGWLAGRIAATAVTPNQISLLSLAFSVAGGVLIAWGAGWACWIGAAICAQLRLLCNLLDGMVAMEGGKASRLGSLYNDLPDRLSDAALLIPLGYAAGSPWLGWAAALVATFTAYVRVLGGSLGQPQDFSGIMAKQHRMNLLCLGLIAQVAESSIWGSRHSLFVAGLLILAGSAMTCWTRAVAIARRLEAG
jgi:phosphatidylglycerophosphate synthase